MKKKKNLPFVFKSTASHKVEAWLEELHDKRRTIELLFRNRKAQLEQCLALALLAIDLRELEDILKARSLGGINFGDYSSTSAEILCCELKKFQAEAKVRSGGKIKKKKIFIIIQSSL